METETGTKASGGSKRKVAIAVVLILLVVVGALAFTQGWTGTAEGKTVAVVNGEEIKQKELDTRYEQYVAMYGSQIPNIEDPQVSADVRAKLVEEIVNEVLVVQHAQNQGVTATDEEISTAFGQIQARYESETAFEGDLKANNLTTNDLKHNLKRELIIQKYIEQYAAQQNIAATEEEVTQLYASLSEGQENAPALADVRAQVEQEVKRQKLAEKIVALVAELKQGANIQILL